MTSETEQLAHDFGEVNKKLAQYPQIHVVQTEGDPPATYEIEYQLTALTRQGNGNIDQTGRHLLRINLPFGYPHFPPTVKPLTPLFHPDIDPDAVRIASQWQQNPSLADLIIHIGEMLCAQKFNLEEPFNQEAADWYREHSADFPLDEIQQGDAEELIAGDLSLEEDDLGLSLEIDDAEENIDEQLEEIRHHIQKNEIVTAGKLLAVLSSSSPEAQELEQTVSAALAKRDRLLQELEELENEDRFSDAYEIFKKIRKIAIDTPALSDIGQRLQQSQAMLDAFSQQDPIIDVPQPTAEKKGAKKKKARKKAPEEARQKEKAARVRKIAKPQINIPVKTLVASVILLAVGSGCIFLYTTSMDKLMAAEQDWIEIKYQRCTTPEEFQEKRIKSEQLLVSISSIFVPGIGKEDLVEEIRAHLSSDKQKEGEAGSQEILLPIDKKINEADQLISSKKYTEALHSCQEIRKSAEAAKVGILHPYAQKINDELDKRISVIDEKINSLQKQAPEEEKLSERKEAEKFYDEAIKLFYELEKKEGGRPDLPDEVIPSKQWDDCIKKLEKAQEQLKKHPEINSPERQKKLQVLLAYSELYKALADARQDYEEGNFDGAIKKYEKALNLLENKRSAFDPIYYKDAYAKIQKTIIILKVSLAMRKADEAENRNDFKTALAHYRKILQLLRNAKVPKDENLDQLEQYIHSKIKELDSQLNKQDLETAKNKHQEWWNKNYKRIFKKEFPSARVSLLSKPRIHFVKVKNGNLLYIIRCSEKKITLELSYQYSLASGTWSPYYEKL
jgi:ubiquitin-protein ligase/tetratricopeptide (TPR) repeat protein